MMQKIIKKYIRNLLRYKPMNSLVVYVLSLKMFDNSSMANRIHLLSYPFPQTVKILVKLNGKKKTLFFEGHHGKDQAVKSAYMHGWDSYEKPLPGVLTALCQSAKSFIDIGANTGWYSLLASVALDNSERRILAFEPVPSLHEILSNNVKLNTAQEQIEVIPVALGDKKGEQILYIPDDAHGLIETSASLNPDFRERHLDKITIRVETLDNYLSVYPLQSVDLIKIDVESYEPNVLSGALNTVKKHRPIIIVEILTSDISEKLKSFLTNNQYLNYNIKNAVEKSAVIIADINFPNHILCPAEKADLMEELLLKRRLML